MQQFQAKSYVKLNLIRFPNSTTKATPKQRKQETNPIRCFKFILLRNDSNASKLPIDNRQPWHKLKVVIDLLQRLLHRRRPDPRRHHLPQQRRGLRL